VSAGEAWAVVLVDCADPDALFVLSQVLERGRGAWWWEPIEGPVVALLFAPVPPL
jgi:hypothetical protein